MRDTSSRNYNPNKGLLKYHSNFSSFNETFCHIDKLREMLKLSSTLHGKKRNNVFKIKVNSMDHSTANR